MKKNKTPFGKLNLFKNDQLHNNKKLRIGFIGGGPNSFIGFTHRLSARFDNRYETVAGVFSKDKKKSIQFGMSLGIDKKRCYNNYIEMAKKESARPDGIEVVGIMTPSGDHYKIVKEFAERNIHVICDKPLTASLKDAVALEKIVKKTKIFFALTHNYSSYPMLREAKNLVYKNKIGKVKLINVEYPQGYTVPVMKSIPPVVALGNILTPKYMFSITSDDQMEENTDHTESLNDELVAQNDPSTNDKKHDNSWANFMSGKSDDWSSLVDETSTQKMLSSKDGRDHLKNAVFAAGKPFGARFCRRKTLARFCRRRPAAWPNSLLLLVNSSIDSSMYQLFTKVTSHSFTYCSLT